jgi:hypothetical protein
VRVDSVSAATGAQAQVPELDARVTAVVAKCILGASRDRTGV